MTPRKSNLWQRLRQMRLQPWERNLYTIVAAEFVAIFGFSISNPFLPFYIQELGVTDFAQVAFWVGLISSTAPITMAVAAPIWGLIADRYGRKPMLVRAMLGGGSLILLNGLATSVTQVAALRILQGALAGTVAAAITLVATTVPRERCGYSLGLLQTAIFVANSLGPSAGGFIGGTLGYRAAFFGSGALLLLAGVLVMLLVQERFVPPPPSTGRGNTLLATARSMFREPIIAAVVIMQMMNSLSGQITYPILPLYVQTLVPSAREASAATGMMLGATAAANALAAVVLGRSADRLGRRRVLLVCVSAASLFYFPQMLTRTPMELLILRTIVGLAMGGVGPIANSIIAERAPQGSQGGLYGISSSLNSLSGALGPVVGTYLVTAWSIRSVFPVTGALLGLIVLMIALTTRSLDRPVATRVDRGPAKT